MRVEEHDPIPGLDAALFRASLRVAAAAVIAAAVTIAAVVTARRRARR